jgi:hypothetical protein
MSGPFSRLTVDTHYNVASQNRVMVTWALNREFINPGPYKFQLYRGLSTNDTKRVKVAEVIDQPFLYDMSPSFPQMGKSLYYVVKLIDGRGAEFWSQAATTDMYWGHRDWLLARDIIRKETLLLRKKTGTKGWLLKRRTWGDPCPDCLDPVTKQVQNARCSTCYGTGFVGGYYDPVEFWITMNATSRMQRLTPEQGVVSENIETARTLAYPPVDTNDVWVNATVNHRYRVQPTIASIARHRGIDIVLNILLEELPESSAAYMVPTP